MFLVFFLSSYRYAAGKRGLFLALELVAQLLFTCLNSLPFSLPQTWQSGVSFFQNTPDIFCPLRHAKALGKYCFAQIKMVLVSKVRAIQKQ